ncbi:unnamed protein product (mitochondrion) [Plasmodiophora brassicae]|uniref:Uncharacterized protein n=1 Tax=Plasmodiophora brassicae TaxID=37360 RepID=A0A0G4ITT4_PLABS|nr:hypothetical protein PBRA_006660 [Plasmodiophora brassicae]SPQ95826.1 unnamed protein product [Plasmodiophora brassicae]
MWAHNNAAAADEVAPVVVDDRKPRGCSGTWPWIAGLLRFLGPGGMIAVGYMDPGNWATDLQAGSQFQYALLSAVLLSSICAMLLQALAIRLGIVSGLDLPSMCRRHFSPTVNIVLYIAAEIAIVACDLAEVIGSALALNLLFGIPLAAGVLLTSFDILVILAGFGPKHLRQFEFMIVALISVVGICFAVMIGRASPSWPDIAVGLIPTSALFANDALFVTLGIVGATVMPHNLYLHSHLVLYRYQSQSPLEMFGRIGASAPDVDDVSAPDAIRPAFHKSVIPRSIAFAQIDSCVALVFAFFVNAAILIVAAAALYNSGTVVDDIPGAYAILTSQLGQWVGIVFAVALLCSGQSSTITATLAGQVVMQGFLGPSFRVPAWARRLVSRGIAIVPALLTTMLGNDAQLNNLLVVSQVILSLQLPFAMWPLIYFTSRRYCMRVCFESSSDDDDDMVETKSFPNSPLVTVASAIVALLITALNLLLVVTWVFRR